MIAYQWRGNASEEGIFNPIYARPNWQYKFDEIRLNRLLYVKQLTIIKYLR